MTRGWMAAVLAALIAVPAGAAEIRTVTVVGNSLTQHGPSEKLGWPYNHGMAATAPEKDFSHLLFEKIRAKVAATQAEPPVLQIAKGAVKERDLSGWKPEAVKDADILVIELGDNYRRPAEGFDPQKHFIGPYTQMLKDFRRSPEQIVVCVSNWGDPGMAQWIKTAAAAGGALYVDIATLGKDPENRAGSEGHFTDKGVNWHPGDRGMARIAEAIWAVLASALDGAEKQ